jgi:hypothetical protein
MSENAVLYTAVYTQLMDALADMKALEELHDTGLIGKYDAAIIDKEGGRPNIVDRVDHPAIRVIPESLGSGPLSHRKLHEAAKALDGDEVALIAVGEPTLEKAFEEAVTRAAKRVKQDMDAATDELASDLTNASKA